MGAPDLVLYLLPKTSKLPLVHPDFIEKYIDVGYLTVGKIMVLNHEEAIVDWCAGYLEAARMDADWMNDEYGHLMLFSISVLAGEFDLVGEKAADGSIIEDATEHLKAFRRELPAQILDIHDYWTEWRQAESHSPEPAVTTKIGRNEPCPCGSGQKYKRCCGG